MTTSASTRLSVLRRLPVYLVLDHSAALKGTLIVSVNGGAQSLRQQLGSNANSAGVYVSMIAFADDVLPTVLAPVDQFSPARLDVSSGCRLGAALSELRRALEYDLIGDRPGRPGDHCPLVIVVLGSTPSDDWQADGNWLLKQSLSRDANVVGVALSPGAVDVLRKIASVVLSTRTGKAAEVSSFFGWLNRAIEEMALSAGNGATTAQLPAFPEGIVQC